jgi:hypothetical protein
MKRQKYLRISYFMLSVSCFKKKQGTDVFYHQGSGTAYYSLVRKSLIYLLSVSSRTAKSILHWLQEVLGLKPRSGKKKWFF